MPVDKGTCLRFYKRKDVQELLLEHAEDKELGTRFNERFGKRPDILQYPKDILELAKRGITSFHCSEEVWHDPLQLSSVITKKEMDELRKGWDLILDIDCLEVEYSKICADLTIKFLKYCGVKDIYAKFSGNKGFHIAVPFEAFPQTLNEKPLHLLFPEAPRKIATYITHNIKEQLAKEILALENGNINAIKEKTKTESDKILYYQKNALGDRIPKLNLDAFIEIDTILIAPRHLYRMPYSLHEKSGLISLPIRLEDVRKFQKPMADPNKFLMPLAPFIQRNKQIEPSATKLLVKAYDFELQEIELQHYKELLKSKNKTQDKNFKELKIESPITEDLFPPCIKYIQNGLEDGKKRAIFAMINFLGKIAWDKAAIEYYLKEWNKKNPEPLKDGYIKGQLAHFKKDKVILPPNCNNEGYYQALNICKPDNLCRRVKNPVNYTIIKYKAKLAEEKRQAEQKEKEEKKQQRQEKKQAIEQRRKEKAKNKQAKAADNQNNEAQTQDSTETDNLLPVQEIKANETSQETKLSEARTKFQEQSSQEEPIEPDASQTKVVPQDPNATKNPESTESTSLHTQK